MKTYLSKRTKTQKSGFSLLEMLTVVGIIGIFASILMPQIGDINDSGKNSAARSTADVICLVLNAAATCGYQFDKLDAWDASTTGDVILHKAETGAVIPTTVLGTFAGQKFTVGDIEADEKSRIIPWLSYDPVNNRIVLAPW